MDPRFQNGKLEDVVKSIIDQIELQNIKVIYFSFFDVKKSPQVVKGRAHNMISIRFGSRGPAFTISGCSYCLNCMLITSYPWDGASFPGNEYWLGQLRASGDPAAACCSTIPFVQNPEINKEYLNGPNTHFFFVDPMSGKYEVAKMSDIDTEVSAAGAAEVAMGLVDVEGGSISAAGAAGVAKERVDVEGEGVPAAGAAEVAPRDGGRKSKEYWLDKSQQSIPWSSEGVAPGWPNIPGAGAAEVAAA